MRASTPIKGLSTSSSSVNIPAASTAARMGATSWVTMLASPTAPDATSPSAGPSKASWPCGSISARASIAPKRNGAATSASG